jgi:hypothetical protein
MRVSKPNSGNMEHKLSGSSNQGSGYPVFADFLHHIRRQSNRQPPMAIHSPNHPKHAMENLLTNIVDQESLITRPRKNLHNVAGNSMSSIEGIAIQLPILFPCSLSLPPLDRNKAYRPSGVCSVANTRRVPSPPTSYVLQNASASSSHKIRLTPVKDEGMLGRSTFAPLHFSFSLHNYCTSR